MKWIILATIVGIVVGLSSTVFLKTLNFMITLVSGKFSFFYFFLPFVLFLNSLVYMYFFPNANVFTTNKIIEYVHKLKDIPILSIPKAFILPILTISFGGSVGKEAPAADIGGALASLFGRLLKLTPEEKVKLVICGISAGFSSIFGTPIAGGIFAVEVLFVGNMLYGVLLPSFVAGIVAFQVSSSLGVAYFHSPIIFNPKFDNIFFMNVVLSGIFFGLCSILLIESVRITKMLVKKIKVWLPLKNFIGGLLLLILILIFSTKYSGLGLDTIRDALQGKNILFYAFLIKILFTTLTIGFRGAGGVVTPVLFIGATSGVFFASILNLDRATFASIGFVSLLAGATNTPIAASILSLEMFGPKIGTYASLACLISFLMTGHRSIYPSQILKIEKSNSFILKKNEEIGGVELQYSDKKDASKTLLGSIFKKIKKFFNK
ncbi:MAG TPA: chloride channel protein [Spirochaetota bacterium]|nr:chloride channel protein [Spirochaetota bacterium]